MVNAKDSVAENLDPTLTEVAALLAVRNVPIFDGHRCGGKSATPPDGL